MNYPGNAAKMQLLMQSEIRNMSIECDRVNGINLSQGMCDLPLQNVLERGVHEALAKGCNHYTRYDGIDELRLQIANKAQHFNKIQVDPATQICVSSGATGALYCTCYALFSPGDEIILFEPYYGYHDYTFRSLDLCPVYAKLSPPDWSFSLNELERLTTEKTKAILINTPSNPCGKVFSREELEAIADFANAHKLFVLTDEIYEYITFDGREHISPASIPQIRDRVITVSGYSKTFSITGWRIGYAIAQPEIIDLIGAANDLIYVCAPAPLQYAVAKAIETFDDTYYVRMCQEYQKKRDLLCHTLTDVGLTPYVPQGAYYVLADVSMLPGETGREKAMWLLEKTKISTVPGEAFFLDAELGKNIVRFCFAKDASVIQQACDRLIENRTAWLK